MSNLSGPDGDKGRSLGGKVIMSQPAPEDCEHCNARGYKQMSQHYGHLGLAKAAANRGLTTDQWCKHLLGTYDPAPWNGFHRQWIRTDLKE